MQWGAACCDVLQCAAVCSSGVARDHTPHLSKRQVVQPQLRKYVCVIYVCVIYVCVIYVCVIMCVS